jgi:hypothetical protein
VIIVITDIIILLGIYEVLWSVCWMTFFCHWLRKFISQTWKYISTKGIGHLWVLNRNHTFHCSPGVDQMIPWHCYANICLYKNHSRMHGKVKYFYSSYSRTFIVMKLTVISVHSVCKSMRLIVFLHSTVLIQSACMCITPRRFKS